MARTTALYMGEINDQQEASWRKTLAVSDEYTNLSLLPDDGTYRPMPWTASRCNSADWS